MSAHVKEEEQPNIIEKVQELAKKWDQHVEKRIFEIEKQKAEEKYEAELEEKFKDQKDQEAAAVELFRSEPEEDASPEEAVEEESKEVHEEEDAVEVKPPTPEELRKAKEEEERVKRYGSPMTLRVRSALYSFDASLRSETRLNVLMHSICHKMGVANVSAVSASTIDGKALDTSATPVAAALKHEDVIMVDSPEIQRLAEHKKEAEAMQERANQEREVEEQQEAARQEMKERTDRRKEEKRARRVAEQKRQQGLQKEGRVTIKFSHEVDGVVQESVLMAVKSNNWLQGTMDLVCKRLQVDPNVARFTLPNKMTIQPEDSVKTLHLKDNDEIKVKTPHHKK